MWRGQDRTIIHSTACPTQHRQGCLFRTYHVVINSPVLCDECCTASADVCGVPASSLNIPSSASSSSPTLFSNGARNGTTDSAVGLRMCPVMGDNSDTSLSSNARLGGWLLGRRAAPPLERSRSAASTLSEMASSSSDPPSSSCLRALQLSCGRSLSSSNCRRYAIAELASPAPSVSAICKHGNQPGTTGRCCMYHTVGRREGPGSGYQREQ